MISELFLDFCATTLITTILALFVSDEGTEETRCSIFYQTPFIVGSFTDCFEIRLAREKVGEDELECKRFGREWLMDCFEKIEVVWGGDNVGDEIEYVSTFVKVD
jgi:hypothetical protein